MDKVLVLPSGCWEWTGARFQQGYGMFWLNGEARRAHRVLYVWMYGEVGDGDDLDHLCRNRACVNPDHLEVATRRENVLRGQGPTAKNARKERSESGNELDYVDPRGWRGSRADRAAASARYREANRAKINAGRRAKRARVVHEERPCEACGLPYIPKRADGRFCDRRECVLARQRQSRRDRLSRAQGGS